MGGLIQFIIRIRIFLLFLFLEGISIYMMVSQARYSGIIWLNSANGVVAEVMAITDAVSDYFNLTVINRNLAEENARLNKELNDLRLYRERQGLDTLPHPLSQAQDSSLPTDLTKQYSFQVAKVINNSVNRQNNYLTLNSGSLKGVVPGMAVISPTGVVGKVAQVSDRFCTVISLLHRRMRISADIKGASAKGAALIWDGADPHYAQLIYVPRHLKPKKGDTVLTSSHSSVFPEGIPVGRIASVSIKDNDTFYEIKVELATDFSSLQYVYLIANLHRKEQQALEAATDPDYAQQ